MTGLVGWFTVAKLSTGQVLVLAGPFIDRAGATVNVEAARLAMRDVFAGAPADQAAEVHFADYGVAKAEQERVRKHPTLNDTLGLQPYAEGRWVR